MKIDLTATLNQGMEAHRAGDLAAAEAAYRRILGVAPGHADALHLLGLVLHQRGDTDAALALVREAVSIDGDVALYHANMGRMLKKIWADKEAAAAFRDALRITPDDAVLHADLASALIGAGDFDAARSRAFLALELAPDLAEAHLNLGLALQELKGVAHPDAVAALNRALALKPTLAGAHLALGVARHEAGDAAGASAAYEAALAQDPSFVEAFCNLGNLKRELCDFEAAARHYRDALALDDGAATVWGNLAVTLQENGQLDRALDAYDRAIAIAPDDAEIRTNRGMALLAAGRFEDGWKDYQYRLQTPRHQRRQRDWLVPRWDGRDAARKRILVHAEQGYGDTLMFCRYLPLLAKKGAKVIVECADALAPLIRDMPGVTAVMTPGDSLPEFDVHVPMPSLPGLMDTRADNIPAEVPYLTVPANRTRKWRRIQERWPTGLRIGIAWRGSPDHARDGLRSPGLAPFLALAEIDGAVLVSLQKEDAMDELAHVPGADRIVNATDNIGDFADTAALVGQLDVVVSCDTAPLHLAGALGSRSIAVLPHVAEWRWGTSGEGMPWYPTMTLIRQPAFGDWKGVFERVVGLLR